LEITDDWGWGAGNYPQNSYFVGIINEQPIVGISIDSNIGSGTKPPVMVAFLIGPDRPDLSSIIGVPEPMSITLFGSAAFILLVVRRRPPLSA